MKTYKMKVNCTRDETFEIEIEAESEEEATDILFENPEKYLTDENIISAGEYTSIESTEEIE